MVMGIKKILGIFSEKLFKYSFLISQLFLSLSAFADFDDPTLGSNNIGQVATKVTSEISQIKTMLWYVAAMAGICIAIHSVIAIRNIAYEKSNRSYVTAFLEFGLGAVMFFLPIGLGIVGSSVFSN